MADDNSYQANQDVIAGARAIRSNSAALAQLVALLNPPPSAPPRADPPNPSRRVPLSAQTARFAPGRCLEGLAEPAGLYGACGGPWPTSAPGGRVPPYRFRTAAINPAQPTRLIQCHT
jgi:hypothetical protein